MMLKNRNTFLTRDCDIKLGAVVGDKIMEIMGKYEGSVNHMISFGVDLFCSRVFNE